MVADPPIMCTLSPNKMVDCCALPVLIAAGALSGAGAAFLADKMPLIALGPATAAALAFAFAARRRTSAGGCADPCTTRTGASGGCRCASGGV